MKEPERFKFNNALPESCVVDLNIRRARRRARDISPSYDPAKYARERRFKVEVLAKRHGGAVRARLGK